MGRPNYRKALLTGAMLLAGGVLTMVSTAGAQTGVFSSSGSLNELAAGAQTMAPTAASAHGPSRISSDLAVTFAPEYARVTNQNCACFWMKGMSAEGSLNFAHGLGVVAQLSQGLASNVQPNVDAHKVSFVAGPRYTYAIGRRPEAGRSGRIFVQSLFGVAHAYNGVFPAAGGVVPSATSSAMELGGGYDLALNRHFGIRAFEAGWVRTSFPNSAANVQNDLRLAFGVSYHLGK